MDTNLVDKHPARNTSAPTINVILGPHRIRATGWLDVIGMVVNGTGLIRESTGFRLFHSEAFEQGGRS